MRIRFYVLKIKEGVWGVIDSCKKQPIIPFFLDKEDAEKYCDFLNDWIKE